MMKKLALIFLLLAVASTANAQLNAKTMESVTLEIVQTGTLAVSGNVLAANLSYYPTGRPQEH